MKLAMYIASLLKNRICKSIIIYIIIIVVALYGIFHFSSTSSQIAKYTAEGQRAFKKSKNAEKIVKFVLNPDTPSAVDTGPTPIILSTYMRSGSSFVGDILQAHDGVFYLFEPLRLTQFDIRRGTPIHFMNGTYRKYHNFLDVAGSMLSGLSQCAFDDVPTKTWADGFLDRSKKASSYRKCMSSLLKSNLSKKQREDICLQRLTATCKESKALVFKVIRTPLSIILPMLEKYPKFKILYLLRDPRATVKSQISYGLIRQNNLVVNVTSFCNRVYDDVMIADMIRQKFPSRILTLFYEDLSYEPLEQAQKIYDFAGLTFSTKQREAVTKMTSSKESKNCHGMCTNKNSSAEAERWRRSITMSLVHMVDACCGQLYQKIGYRDIPNEEILRDLHFNLRKSPIGMGDYRFA